MAVEPVRAKPVGTDGACVSPAGQAAVDALNVAIAEWNVCAEL